MALIECSDECREYGCPDPTECDDGLCDFCGEYDCDGTGYNCPDEHYDNYNLEGYGDDDD